VRALGLTAACSVIIGGLVLALSLNSSQPTKIVHVVVTTTARSKIALPQAARPPRAHHHRTLPPAASAGTNGSFTPPSRSSSLLKPAARASFAQLQASLPGPVDVALVPLGLGRSTQLGGDSPAHGWSTTKVPVLVALLRARGAHGLTAAEQGWARLAITESDNQSILDLFGDLEQLEGGLAAASSYVQQVLRLSGDPLTVVATAPPPPGAATTFGQTEWAPSEAVKFFRALADGCLLPSGQSSYVLNLMQSIVPSESWGLGSGGFNVPVAFKDGWGPEPTGSYLVRQSGIIDPGSPRGVAVSIVAYPPAGGDSFSVGTQMLTSTAQWLRGQLLLQSHPTTGCGAS
jgi:hypothetical protein